MSWMSSSLLLIDQMQGKSWTHTRCALLNSTALAQSWQLALPSFIGSVMQMNCPVRTVFAFVCVDVPDLPALRRRQHCLLWPAPRALAYKLNGKCILALVQ